MSLYQHQLEGAAWLAANPKGYLAHKPGLGKTRTLIEAAHLAGVQRPLIVTPAIVRTHWAREYDAMQYADGGPIIKSYDEIMRGGNALMQVAFNAGIDALILDEAHYLKHATAARTRQLLGKDGYARRLDIVWPASGTPLPRNPAEIWTLLATLHPRLPLARGIFSYQHFVKRYCITRGSMVRGVWREKIVGNNPDTLAELKEMLSEFMLVKGLEDVGLDVPAIDWQLTRLDPVGLSIFAQHVNDYAPLVGGAIATNRLAEITSDPHVARMRRQLGEFKAPAVVEMLKSQLENSDEKVAVFAHHRSVLRILRDGLQEFGVAYVDGDTSPRARDQAIADFEGYENDYTDGRVFIGQNIACATGMDGLQHATNRAVLVEPDWTPDVNYQLGHRVARMGSTHDHAIVQMIALAGTLDEAIVAQNKRETEMVAQAMPAGV